MCDYSFISPFLHSSYIDSADSPAFIPSRFLLHFANNFISEIVQCIFGARADTIFLWIFVLISNPKSLSSLE